jgi:hypothetical protein
MPIVYGFVLKRMWSMVLGCVLNRIKVDRVWDGTRENVVHSVWNGTTRNAFHIVYLFVLCLRRIVSFCCMTLKLVAMKVLCRFLKGLRNCRRDLNFQVQGESMLTYKCRTDANRSE